MRKTIFAIFLCASNALAVEPLQCDQNPANYTPFVTYFDQGSGQQFYYDNNQNSFFVYEAGVASSNTQTYVVANDLHAIAYARAAAMAALDMFFPNHSIPNAPLKPYNVSEGIGMGYTPSPATCVLPGVCVADAAAVSVTGRTYRVRFFQ